MLSLARRATAAFHCSTRCGDYRSGVPRNVAPRYTALHKVYVWCGGGAEEAVVTGCACTERLSTDEGAQCNDRHAASPYPQSHRHGAALDDVTNVHKNSNLIHSDDRFLKSGRITRETYDEVRRMTVPRFVVLWEEGEPLPPPDVALVCRPCLGTGLMGDKRVCVCGRGDLLYIHVCRNRLVIIVQ
jgi:hypothetical protein